MPVPVRTEAACWLSSPAGTKTATRSAVSSLCSCRGRLAVGCTEQGAVWFLCFLGSQTNLQEMASEERIRAHLRLPLLPSGGGTSNQALLESSQSHSAVTVDAVFAGCTCSRTGSSSKNRKLRWILLFFYALVHAYFHSSLSSLILSVPSSPETLCPPMQSAPSTLAQWAASQQSLGAHHCPVSQGTDILK